MKLSDRFSTSNQKINIFIGSSSESKEIAYAIKSYFEEETFNVTVWDKAFDSGVSNLDNLKKFTAIYDYSIMLMVNDNIVIHRKNEYGAIPPNIIFEVGLFYGRMGESKSFLIAEKSISSFIDNVFSDFKGISLGQTFINDKTKSPEENVKEAAESIKEKIKRRYSSSSEIGFLPSTALAIGYFENFIIQVGKILFELRNKEDGILNLEYGKEKNAIEYNFPFFKRKFKIKVVLPQILLEANYDNLEGMLVDGNMDNTYIKVPNRIRTFGIYWKIQTQKEIDNDGFVLYDFPTTLFSSQKAIEMVLRTSSVMNIDDLNLEELIGEKEIFNFVKALKYQIQSSRKTYLRDKIEIINFSDVFN